MGIRLADLEATITALEAENAALKAANAEWCEISAKQCALIRKFQVMLFGKKTEKAPPAETTTPPTAPQTESSSSPPETAASPPPETSAAPAKKRKRGQRRDAPGHGRRPYDELKPREELHELSEEERRCPTCDGFAEPCGTEDSSEVEWKVTIELVIHRRMKYRFTCTCDQIPRFITAPPPPKLIPKGLLSVGATANLLVNKYLHGQPLNRQIHDLALWCGVHFAPGTLAGVLTTVGDLLRPLYDAMLLHLRDADHWHADETRWMLAGDRWWLWVFASAEASVFVLDPTRSKAVPLRVFGLDVDTDELIRRVAGILNCDRWKSYRGLPGIRLAYCWAHVRRDFLNLRKGYPCSLGDWATAWVERIGRLYHLTAQRLLYEPGTEAFRQADLTLRDHVAAIALCRDAQRRDPKLLQDARKVLDSLENHWEGLTLFLDHLEVPLDNNEAERLIRTPVVGRKNFYGSGSRSNGALAECAYTLLMTAAKNELNPLTYLRAYLTACAVNGGQAPTDLTPFLPWTASAEDLATWKRPPTAE